MSQNSKFKLKYDELRAGDPTHIESKNESAPLESETSAQNSTSNVRNICFVWPNGRQKFFNYAYLTSGELNVENETNTITLNFTADIVILKGYNLQDLFVQLRHHTASFILQVDTRYATIASNESTVIEITVTPST